MTILVGGKCHFFSEMKILCVVGRARVARGDYNKSASKVHSVLTLSVPKSLSYLLSDQLDEPTNMVTYYGR